jgi:hypothetical protein
MTWQVVAVVVLMGALFALAPLAPRSAARSWAEVRGNFRYALGAVGVALVAALLNSRGGHWPSSSPAPLGS